MTAVFICDTSPSLRLKVRGRKVQFENKKLELTDQADIAYLERLMVDSAHVGSLIRRLDFEAGEALVKAHMAKQPPVAVKGMVTSEIQKQVLNQMNDEIENMVDTENPEAVAAYNMLIAENPDIAQLERADIDKAVAVQMEKIEAANAAAEAEAAAELAAEEAAKAPTPAAAPKTFNLGKQN